MPRHNRPRSSLKAEHSIRPALAARHKVVHNPEDQEDTATGFFLDLRNLLENTFDAPASQDTVLRRAARPKFTLYEDSEKTAITILERRLSHDFAQKHRIHWSPKDIGRISGEIQNSLFRLDLAGRPLDVEFDNVVRVGDADEKRARKLALVPNQASSVSEFFCQEHEIAVEGISSSLKRFRYPYGPFIPHFTICRLFKELPVSKVNAAITAIKTNLLPLTVEVQPIEIYSQLKHTPTELWSSLDQAPPAAQDYTEGPDY